MTIRRIVNLLTRTGHESREKSKLMRCSFCGHDAGRVEHLISGPGVYICNKCVDLCNEILEEKRAGQPH